MYGVILWSDPDGGQAVIWCEDCGDLAYYQAPAGSEQFRHNFFDTGDYVEFEVVNDNRLRRARNAQTVTSAQCPRVAHTLQRGAPETRRTQGGANAKGDLIRLSEHPTAQARRPGDISHLG